MDTFTRGATVNFSVVFRDAAGEVTNPTAAVVVLSYFNTDRQRVSEEVELTQGVSAWTGEWDSRPARHGKVYAHVRSSAPAPLSAYDFEFLLVVNEANEAA